MGFVGRNADAAELRLDPNTLVRLARDLMVSRGHVLTRRTDGPGDGKRDVHSLMPDGAKHLVQCKHHHDPNVACSSSDLDELPMALLKLGYRKGLFLTDAKISPQAKREYLDNYPGFELEFMDGSELAVAVMSDAALRALWFDGVGVAAVNSRVVWPVLVRRQDDDSPFLPMRRVALAASVEESVRAACAEETPCAIEVSESSCSPVAFHPHRLPRLLTMEEGGSPEYRVTQFSVRGAVALHEITSLARTIGRTLASTVSVDSRGYSVTVGQPSITPIEGQRAGVRMLLEGSRESFVGIAGRVSTEAEWFLPPDGSGWTTRSDARSSQAEDIRVYSKSIDVAVDYSLSSSPLPIQLILAQVTRRGWEDSVFALVPSWEETWPYAEIAEPDTYAQWSEDSTDLLCAWFHARAGGGGPSLVSLPMDHGDDELGDLVNERAERRRLDKIGGSLLKRGLRIIPPRVARHMAAIANGDPLDEGDERRFGVADLMFGLEAVGTPVAPASRRASVTIVWEAGKVCEPWLTTAIWELAESLTGEPKIRREKRFLIGEVTLRDLHPRESTPQWFARVLRVAGKVLGAAEDAVLRSGETCKRCTFEYWRQEYGFSLGIAYGERSS